MDTKLRSIKYSAWFKLLAVLLGLAGVAVSFFGLLKAEDYEYSIQSSDYYKSSLFEQKVDTTRSYIRVLWNEGNLFKEQKGYLSDEELANESAPDYYTILNMRENLAETAGLHYSVVSGGKTYGDSLDFFNSLPYSKSFTESDDLVVYLGFEKDALAQQKSDFEARRQNGLNGIYMFAGGLLLSLLSMLWLMYVAGRTRKEDDVKLNTLDRVYLDLGFCITAGIFGLLVSLDISIADSSYGGSIFSNEGMESINFPLFSALMISILSAAYLVALLYAVTFSKRFKRKEVFSHTFIYKACSIFVRFFQNLSGDIRAALDNGPMARKAAVFLIIYGIVGGGACLLTAVVAFSSGVVFFGFIATLVVYIIVTLIACRFMTKRLAGFRALSEGVRMIKEGALEHKIPLSGSHSIDSVSNDINNISQGLKAAVENEMTAERMKVELITNVSHDLRTPLTSIITYADLLSAGDVTPEQVHEYSEILKAKSDKLKHLVDDLFEVSKAQSGTMPLELGALNLNDLLTQTMAEYQEGFESNRLDVKIATPNEKISVMADGSRMWRVLSNIFSNIVKYSMAGTRVYIDVEADNGNASVIFRNISGSPMNFKSEEMFERFRRGDESRSGDGSGLGLAIVRSFMDIQKGSCSISTDGDLFKLKLTLPLA